jgi:predicted nucleic acid-binding protein
MTVALDDPAVRRPDGAERVAFRAPEEWYVEASALVKLFVVEERSVELGAWLDALEERGGSVLVSDLSRTEVYRAVVRASPGLSGTVGPLLDDFAGVRVSERDFARARVLQPMSLRTLDALHLAVVLGVDGGCAGIVTYDHRIVEAAAAVGIRTVSP